MIEQLLDDLTKVNPVREIQLSDEEEAALSQEIETKSGSNSLRLPRETRHIRLPSRILRIRQLAVAAVSFAIISLIVGLVAFRWPAEPDTTATPIPQQVTTPSTAIDGFTPNTADDASPPTTIAATTAPTDLAAVAPSAETGGTPLPDIENAIAGDDGTGPLSLGTIDKLPDNVHLNFLFEFCHSGCFRDAHFMDPDDPSYGSGPFTAGRPFHVRHGFPASDQPLGPGFDVVIYVTPMDVPGEFGGASVGETLRYTSDYVLRGESDACGPNYKSQPGPVTCEWFVHDFSEGLPAGRFGLWAFWEAPCSAWVGYGLADSCEDPSAVMSLFRSGFDSPFDEFPPSYTELNEAGLTPGDVPEPVEPETELGPPIDASGAVANFSTNPPDFGAAIAGDDGSGPLPLGTVSELPGEDYLNFLFEFCQPQCYRDAHFMDPDNPDLGSGPWTAGRPFHVRHGFQAPAAGALGPGFDVVLYITPADWTPGEHGGEPTSAPVRYTSDYVFRGESDACGPTYKTQIEPITCEWFVHDFPTGLPAGRYDLWAFWEAPCSAWVEYGFTASCSDPNEVMSLFSSGVNSPFDDGPPSFTERNEA